MVGILRHISESSELAGKISHKQLMRLCLTKEFTRVSTPDLMLDQITAEAPEGRSVKNLFFVISSYAFVARSLSLRRSLF